MNIIETTKDADLLAPVSLHWEIGNAFSAMFKRGKIRLEQAIEALSNYHEIPIRFIDVDLEASIYLSNQLNINAYDAYFVVCAQNEKAHLLTLDNQLLKISRELGIKVLGV